MNISALTHYFTARRLSTLVILLLPFVYFYPAVIGRVALVQGDGWLANLGLRVLTGRMMAAGELPLWNPYLFGGMPLLASVYPGVLYPPNWLFAVLRPSVAMNLVVITTYHIALAGAYRYARAVGIDRVGALVAALVFAFGAYLVMSLGQTANIASAAWLPWVVLAVERLRARATWRWISLGACFIALQIFAGVPQMAWYTALVAGAYAAFCLIRSSADRRKRFALAFVAMYALGGLLALVQLLPLREMQVQGGRAQITYEYFAEFSFPPRQLLALVFPYFFGGATMPPYQQTYWGADGIFVTGGYVGLLSLLLALVALLGGRKQPLVWFWAAAAVVALLLASGAYLPFGINRLFYRLPVYNLFRASFRHLFEFTFACGVLAGWGAHWLRHSEPQQTKRFARISVIALGVLVVGAWLAYRFWPRLQPRSFFDAEAIVPMGLFVLSAAALWLSARRPTRRAAAVLLAVLFIDLLAYGHGLEWRAYRLDVAARLADPPTVALLKARESDLHAFRIVSDSVAPFGGDNYELLNFPNNSLARGIESANGYDMLRLTRPAEVFGAMSPEGMIADPSALGLAHRGFDLGNVKYLLSDRDAAPPAARWRELARFGTAKVYENLHALPRAWFVRRAVIAPEADVLRTIKEGTLSDGSAFDPAETALLEQETLHQPPSAIGKSADATATIIRYAPQRIVLQTRNEEAGLLVLSEVFYPGWQATVDGVAAPIHRVDYALRGLLLPKGEHWVELVYAPASVRWGALGSGFTALLLLACFLFARRNV